MQELDNGTRALDGSPYSRRRAGRDEIFIHVEEHYKNRKRWNSLLKWRKTGTFIPFGQGADICRDNGTGTQDQSRLVHTRDRRRLLCIFVIKSGSSKTVKFGPVKIQH